MGNCNSKVREVEHATERSATRLKTLRFTVDIEGDSTRSNLIDKKISSGMMDEDIKKILLSSLEKCAYIDGRSINALLSAMRKERIASGIEIMKEGNKGNRMFVLISGKVQVLIKKKPIREMEAVGTIFGELALLFDCPRTASVYAINETVVYTLMRHDFKIIQRHSSHDSFLFRSRSLLLVDEFSTSHFSPERLSTLISAFSSMRFEHNQKLFTKDQIADKVSKSLIYLFVSGRRTGLVHPFNIFVSFYLLFSPLFSPTFTLKFSY